MEKRLDITENVLVNSECWTYYKFSVMQTIANFDVWLASHMKIYIDQNGNAIFGENGVMYPLSYFSDILSFYDGQIMSIKKDEIVNYLIEQIDKGNYIIIDLNYPRMGGVPQDVFWLHETLIYGYDNVAKEFFTQLLTNGGFKERRIGFNRIENAFDDAISYYSEDKNRLFNRRTWFYGITCIKPNKNYKNSNAYYDFICKLKSELEGCIYKKYRLIDGKESENCYSYATGLSCLVYLSAYMKKIIKENNDILVNISRCRKSCTKIYENQSMIKISLKWFIESQKGSNDIINHLSFEYQKCCDIVLLNVRRFYKYQKNQDKSLLYRIINDLNELYLQEKVILERLIEELTRLYKSKM